eukprot:snap_masked-scaffold_29-processed-gene-0.6-mRNA-1 protein AED:1.00 eAED:1.00 QI:0/0/0/0/1/1/3/0/68
MMAFKALKVAAYITIKTIRKVSGVKRLQSSDRVLISTGEMLQITGLTLHLCLFKKIREQISPTDSYTK